MAAKQKSKKMKSKYKTIRLPTYINQVPVTDILDRCVAKKRPFVDERGKTTEYYYVIPKFFKNNRTDEFVYWDSERQTLVRTGLKVYDGKTKKEADLHNWEEEYQKHIAEVEEHNAKR
jgi:hypothetical protein